MLVYFIIINHVAPVCLSPLPHTTQHAPEEDPTAEEFSRTPFCGINRQAVPNEDNICP